MRRAAALVVLAAVALVAAALGCGGGPRGTTETFRVDALFDNAAFVVPGQDVRIAGVTAGTVKDLEVTGDHRARIEMEVDRRFAPFRSDADCFIAPQSLIGERFVQCTPGTPRGEVLAERDGRPPTVPLENTHSPVDPDVVLSTFELPVRERLSIILNELGTGLAANGEALAAAIRRSNPALGSTREVLRIVNEDREVLGRLIDRSDGVIAALAKRRGRVAAFIDEAQRVATIAARRDGAVSEGIRRLPGTLDETRASLDALRVLADRSLPLLDSVRTATPALTRLVGDVPPLATAARPALGRLSAMARTGRGTLREGAPTVRLLRTFARRAVPAGRLLATLNESLRENGAVEGLQFFYYNIALAISRYDEVSHILPAYAVSPPECATFARTTTPSCSAHFVKGEATEAAARARRRARRTGEREERRPAPRRREDAPGPAPATEREPARQPPAKDPVAAVTDLLPTVPDAEPPPRPSDPAGAVAEVLDYLLGP